MRDTMSKQILTADDVLHLGRLTQLSLTDREVKKYQQQLTETLEYVKNLSEIAAAKPKDKDNLTADSHKNIFFEDQIASDRVLSQAKALANAPKQKDQYFVVERIL